MINIILPYLVIHLAIKVSRSLFFTSKKFCSNSIVITTPFSLYIYLIILYNSINIFFAFINTINTDLLMSISEYLNYMEHKKKKNIFLVNEKQTTITETKKNLNELISNYNFNCILNDDQFCYYRFRLYYNIVSYFIIHQLILSVQYLVDLYLSSTISCCWYHKYITGEI